MRLDLPLPDGGTVPAVRTPIRHVGNAAGLHATPRPVSASTRPRSSRELGYDAAEVDG